MSSQSNYMSSQRQDAGTLSARKLSVNAYDRTATMIIASLVVLGTTVTALGFIFFANKMAKPVIKPIAFVPVEATSPTANGGIGTDPEPPGMEEVSELAEPQLGDTLSAVSAAAVYAPAVFAEEGVAAAGQQAGKGKGLGDGRMPGPGSDGVIERVPRWERWKIRFEPQSAAEFAEWLDHFKIKVAVLGSDNKVHVASNFTAAAPTVESAAPQAYANWGQTVPADGPMPALTNELAQKAGIMKFGRIALLFYPFEVESLLWTLEKEKNKTGDPNRIRETVFTVGRTTDSFEFQVVDQKYF